METGMGWFQIVLYFALLLLAVKPLGTYMAQVYRGEGIFLAPLLQPLERFLYRLAGVDTAVEMNWRGYAVALLLFNTLGALLLYAVLRLQHLLPLNPANLGPVEAALAFNTAASFVSNTNWQFYSGEVSLSYLTQMLGLTVQNFVSAATGMAVLVALMRGIVRQSAQMLGNFWVDLTRGTIYILLPLSLILALMLVSQGVIQTLSPAQTATLVQPTTAADGNLVREQIIALGPVASQIAIKQLGTNGGGFFNVNSAHPFENPTPFSNLLQMLAILLIPAALCYTFGHMVGDLRQGWALLATMTIVCIAFLAVTYLAEQAGNPQLTALGVDQAPSAQQAGGNMEGKELRFGIANSALWAVITTAASNGSVNSMHDSYTPLGSLGPLLLMQLGEVIFGGVGSGLYGMLIFVIIAVFVAGLMVGRTPEYLNKKIEAFEMKMASLVILIPPALVLLGTALAVISPFGLAAVQDGGPHAFSELLYAFTSQGNNNGSAFAGISANPAFAVVGGVIMLIARFWLIVAVLALAGALAAKKKIPAGAGTLPTHTPLFVGWLITIVVVVGALAFFPALALGPVVEQLFMRSGISF